MRKLALLAAIVALPAAAQPLSDGRKAELDSLVRQDCGSCHGMTLKGGLGRPLLPGDLARYSTRDLTGIILDGIPGTPMPPWKALISRADAEWIARSLKKGLEK